MLVEGQVRLEDQQRINEFGRLNNRLLEIRDDKAHIKVKARIIAFLVLLRRCILFARMCAKRLDGVSGHDMLGTCEAICAPTKSTAEHNREQLEDIFVVPHNLVFIAPFSLSLMQHVVILVPIASTCASGSVPYVATMAFC